MRRDTFDVPRHLKDSHKFLGLGYVVAYSDGSYNVKNGSGGYGVFMRHGVMEKRVSAGPVFNTRIVQMELYAILEVLKMVNKKEQLIIYCDSQYSINLVMGWSKTRDDKNLLLIDLIGFEYDKFGHKPKIKWIPSHLDIEGSQVADKLADDGRKIKKYSKE
jgi:ribonuclease HI